MAFKKSYINLSHWQTSMSFRRYDFLCCVKYPTLVKVVRREFETVLDTDKRHTEGQAQRLTEGQIDEHVYRQTMRESYA